MNSARSTQTSLAISVAFLAFLLGRYVDHFRGTWNSWAAVIIAGTLLLIVLYLLIRNFRR
jgi:chromate transport protein ChrA